MSPIETTGPRKAEGHEAEKLERLVIPRAVLDELEQSCLADTTVEVCGLLGGFGELAQSFYATANVAENPKHGYVVDPKDQIQALRTMRQRREEMLAIFHSHPNSRAEPSATDLSLAAYPGIAYLIASMLENPPKFEAYLFTGKQFDALPLTVLDTHGP